MARGHGLATLSSAVARDLYLYQGKLEGIKGAFQGFYRAVFSNSQGTGYAVKPS